MREFGLVAGIVGNVSAATYSRIGMNHKDNGVYEGLVDTLYQDGCALLITKTCYERIGGFDDSLWTYWEETDLCLRARDAGFRVCCQQSAKVWHKVSATLRTPTQKNPHAVYCGVRNSYIFHRRNARSRGGAARAVLTLLSRTPRAAASIAFKTNGHKINNLLQ